jgi:hypothetical protein
MRLAARASRRLAAFPQAIKSTMDTAQSSSHKRERTWPTLLSTKFFTEAPQPRIRGSWSLSSRVMIAAISACASAMETPGLRRATALPLVLSRSASS